MFTGLVEGIGKIKTIQHIHDDVTFTIMPLFDFTGCRLGDSVSVNGVCLTVTKTSEGAFSMDVSQETISRSTLHLLRHGDEVNLERALLLTSRLGGHLVTGHVDGIGKIIKKESRQRSWFIRLGIDEKLSSYIIEKGSIAVDGVSLTVNRCEKGSFEVNIIPQTGKETILLKKEAGDLVNIETDLIGKYVEMFTLNNKTIKNRNTASEIDMKMLTKHGFGN